MATNNGEVKTTDMLDQMEAEAQNENVSFTMKFSKPFSYGGRDYSVLCFNWENLTGQDFIDIETEIAAHGKILISPQYSSEFLAIMAAKASSPSVGADLIKALPIGKFNNLRVRARNFLNLQE